MEMNSWRFSPELIEKRVKPWHQQTNFQFGKILTLVNNLLINLTKLVRYSIINTKRKKKDEKIIMNGFLNRKSFERNW